MAGGLDKLDRIAHVVGYPYWDPFERSGRSRLIDYSFACSVLPALVRWATKVFLEPREFDLLYWIQGSAAAPYLREGEFTTPGTWAQLQRVFDRRVFRYSFWFN